MTRHRKSERYWPSESFGESKRWTWKTIPLSEITSYAGHPPEDRPSARATQPVPAKGTAPSTVVEDLERLDSVVHNFLACLNPDERPVPIDRAMSADIER